jgi:hypothetical protein
MSIDKTSPSATYFGAERSLPRRHHTIGNIRYDSSAYKTVSFQDDEPKVDRSVSAGVFRHMKHAADAEEECAAAKNRPQDLGEPSVEAFPGRSEGEAGERRRAFPEQMRLQRSEEEEGSDVVARLASEEARRGSTSINISRSKSFGDVTMKKGSKKAADDDDVWMVPSSKSTSRRPEEPTLRSKSFKDISSKPGRSNRFSWDVDSMSLGSGSSLRDLPSHLRSSLASLTSLDLHSASPVSLDTPARELASKPGVLCGFLEIKSKSGLRTFKKYWCALDGPAFYIYSREKDPKAKQAVYLAGYKVKAVKTAENGLGSSFRSEVKKKGRQFELTPATGSKDGRQFAAATKEEADVWTRRIQEAIDGLADQPVEPASGGRPAEPAKVQETVPFWRQHSARPALALTYEPELDAGCHDEAIAQRCQSGHRRSFKLLWQSFLSV